MRAPDLAEIAARNPRGGASWPLVPYSNRIRDARFPWRGRMIELARDHLSGDHAIHGQGWRRPWQVVSADATRAVLEQRHAPDGFWPFAYRARQDFILAGGRLDMRIELVNAGDRRMPSGFGLHPYFPRTPRCRLHAAVTGLWETDDAILPTSLVAPEAPRDPRIGLAVDAVPLDNCFTGWGGHAEIVWPETETALAMTADGPMGFFVVYTPTGEPYFCAEPVSNATDAVNLAAAGRDDTGLLVLEPGQAASARIVFAPRGPA
jgi:aldose 1-epimerase